MPLWHAQGPVLGSHPATDPLPCEGPNVLELEWGASWLRLLAGWRAPILPSSPRASPGAGWLQSVHAGRQAAGLVSALLPCPEPSQPGHSPAF